MDVKTLFLNARDLVFFVIGTLQSVMLIYRLKPNAILLKGGFVGVPVGFAAAFRHFPFITHDSDALPGLANRLVSRWAAYHATGMPPEEYAYPPEKMRYVGVLVSRDYRPVSAKQQLSHKKKLGLPEQSRLLLVTGGSLGAFRLNQALSQLAPKLLEAFPDLYLIHQVGKGQGDTYGDFTHERLQVLEFLQPMYRYTGAADVVVTRAGANTLAELAVQGRACVVVPNPLLTGGHQLKNAEGYERAGAIVTVDETAFKASVKPLDTAIRELLRDKKKRAELERKFQAVSLPDAAHKLAMLLLEIAKKTS